MKITLRYSSLGLALTEDQEGFRSQAYRDCAGVLTIAYGHTGPDVFEGLVVSLARGIELLRNDVHWAENCVNRMVTRDAIGQDQFDALVDFVFNEGAGHFQHSSLLALVNAGRDQAAALEFAKWDLAGGKRVGGLVRRRAAEAALFLKPDVAGNATQETV